MPTLDPSLVTAVKGFENFAAVAFWDEKQWTNGYGTRAHFPKERISEATAEQRLTVELLAAQGQVDSLDVQGMPLGARKALTDLTFNAGFGWSHAGLGVAVMQKDWAAAKLHLLEYDRAGGKVSADLVERRRTEASWFDEVTIVAIAQAEIVSVAQEQQAMITQSADLSSVISHQ